MSTSYDEWTVQRGVEVWRSVTTGSGTQRILPDACLDLIFDGERVLVAGPDATARVHHRETSGTVTGVRLHAGRGPVLLGVPADELRDRTLALDDVWGTQRARELTERVAERPRRALAAWAGAGDVSPDPFGARLRDLLERQSSVAGAADALGYSTRQLHRRTLPVFGYGPQHLRRVLRLLRAVDAADAGGDWADVALRAGYVDQAHLARDFGALAGATPGELRRERDVRSVQDAA
jgi:AraC-like DNA-binding protein